MLYLFIVKITVEATLTEHWVDTVCTISHPHFSLWQYVAWMSANHPNYPPWSSLYMSKANLNKIAWGNTANKITSSIFDSPVVSTHLSFIVFCHPAEKRQHSFSPCSLLFHISIFFIPFWESLTHMVSKTLSSYLQSNWVPLQYAWSLRDVISMILSVCAVCMICMILQIILSYFKIDIGRDLVITQLHGMLEWRKSLQYIPVI